MAAMVLLFEIHFLNRRKVMKKSKRQKRIYLPESNNRPLTKQECRIFKLAAARKQAFTGLVFRSLCRCYRDKNCYVVIQKFVDLGKHLTPGEKAAFRAAAKRR
jgi:hypothetical protein